ncbi:MAG: hypothetical protein O9297_06945 [Flavobacterium sp.]|nr:hypothetical protein [Flavobacterium sp.]
MFKLLKASFGLGIFLFSLFSFVRTILDTKLLPFGQFLKNWILKISNGLFQEIEFYGIVLFVFLVFSFIEFKTKKS